MTLTPRDLIDDLRSRINPAYAEQLGTESCERRLCAEALEAQAEDIEVLRSTLAALLAGDVGKQTLWKLGTGQGTNTDDGRAWLRAAAMMTPNH